MFLPHFVVNLHIVTDLVWAHVLPISLSQNYQLCTFWAHAHQPKIQKEYFSRVVLDYVMQCISPSTVQAVIYLIFFQIWIPYPETAALFFVLPALWGISDAVWQTQLNGKDFKCCMISIEILSCHDFKNHKILCNILFFI